MDPAQNTLIPRGPLGAPQIAHQALHRTIPCNRNTMKEPDPGISAMIPNA